MAKQYGGGVSLDVLYCFKSGSADIQLEVSIDGSTEWVPFGDPVSSSQMVRELLPEGIWYRFNVTNVSGADIHLTAFEE